MIAVGMLVRIIAVNHPNFADSIGSVERVTRISADSQQAWCKPTKLFPRKTRKGVVMVEANWEVLRGVDQIQPVY